LQVSSDNLGKIYQVLNRSRSKTLEEELQENSEMFLLKILVPVYEGFKFSNEIRDRECGIPHPQLVFYGWEINAMDPFHVSMTDDELEEFGEQELHPNKIKQIIDEIRKRKGLPIDKMLIKDGSKQVTLSANK
jgi:translation elongation factor EF-G